MEMFNAISLLAACGISVNLNKFQSDYESATSFDKDTTTKFVRSSSFVKIPEATKSGTGSLNLRFEVPGSVDGVECKMYQNVSIIRNGELNRTKFFVLESDIPAVKNLGMQVDESSCLDLAQFTIEAQPVDVRDMFVKAVATWCSKINSHRPKSSEPKSEIENGIYNPAKINFVPPTYEHNVKISIEKCSAKPKMENLTEKLSKGKKLTFSESILNEVVNNNMKFKDFSEEVNEMKFNIILSKFPAATYECTAKINGIEFSGTVTIG